MKYNHRKPQGLSAMRQFSKADIDRLRSLYHYDPLTGDITSAKGKSVVYISTDYLRVHTPLGDILAHRLAWMLYYGESPSLTVDHINRCKTDNRICNLRLATMKEQNANRVKHKFRKTCFKGISQEVETGMFYTSFWHKQHYYDKIDDVVVFRIRHNLEI